MTRSLFCFALIAAAWLLSSTPASAQLELCNRTSFVLYAAVATQDKNGVTTQGWTRVVPGDCKTAIDSPLEKGNFYYIYAKASPAHAGQPRDWGGNVRLCTLPGNFKLHTPLGTVRCSAEAAALPFTKLQTNALTVWTTTFTESDALGNVDAARTAGLKRLLEDNGAELGAIDGKPDKKTGGALADFRKRMKIAQNAPTGAMFDALETEALKTAAPTGYSICNDADSDVWATIAMKGGKDWVTRGWWKVAPATCVKAITAPLKIDAIYLHAEKHAMPNLVSGADKFCLTNMQFELQGRGNCAKRGLTEVGFAVTTTKGLQGFVAHVGNQGLVAPMKAKLKVSP